MLITHAPGRVNLIGDHTDHLGGLCLPMAIDLGTTVEGEPGGAVVRLTSDALDGTAVVPLDVEDPSTVEPPWARLVAGVVAELRPVQGFVGRVTTTLPVGAGQSSSAAFEVAVALALGADDEPVALARLCQRAERRACGVPCGILDQLTSTSGVAGHALLLDCSTLDVTPVPVPPDIDIVVVHSGEARRLAGSPYAQRRAEAVAGHERRLRHVRTENQRVLDAAGALRSGDGAALGELFVESHRSLARDFEVSTPKLDALVARLCDTTGVHGARLTGAGFGGCVVAVTDPGALREGWRVSAAPRAGRCVPGRA